MRKIVKFIFRLIITPILIAIALLILIVYIIFGLIVVPIMTVRYLGLTVIAAINSAFKNEDFTNKFLDALYEFLEKYVKFFSHIFFIPAAVWIPANTNKSDLQNILDYEYEIFSKRWLTSILIFAALIFSFALSFSLLGLRGLDFLNLDLKQKINHYIEYKDFNFEKENDDITQKTIDSIQKNTEKAILEINEFYESKIDSVNLELSNLSNIKESDKEKIDSLIKRVKSLESRKPKVKYEYIETTPYYQYGKNQGRLGITSGCTKGYGNIKVWVNDEYWGVLQNDYSSHPGCNTSAGLFKNVPAGQYNIKAEGKSTSWDFLTYVSEDNCNTRYLGCE